jgi:hypothetical protein
MRLAGFNAESSLYKTSEHYQLESIAGFFRDRDALGVSPAGDDDCCYWTWSLFFWGICCADARIAGRYDKCCPR